MVDTVLFIRDSLAGEKFADSLPTGIWQGMFPCKGCNGVQQTISFDADRTYLMEQEFWGKDGRRERWEGKWERRNGSIFLSRGGKEIEHLAYDGTQLRVLRQELFPSSSDDSSKYVLKKVKLATSNPSWMKKKEEGVDFFGLGNEPFWSLEIDKEKFILFRLADWKEPVITPAATAHPLRRQHHLLHQSQRQATAYSHHRRLRQRRHERLLIRV